MGEDIWGADIEEIGMLITLALGRTVLGLEGVDFPAGGGGRLGGTVRGILFTSGMPKQL